MVLNYSKIAAMTQQVIINNSITFKKGICTLNSKNEIIQTKFASDILTNLDCIKKLIKVAPPRHSGHFIGLGHTRWATCGEKSDINPHPHNDYVRNLSFFSYFQEK